jgi:DNA-binding response OmpR family regulator
VNVLLIDHDSGVASTLADVLGARGHEVWHAATARDADIVIAQVQPDVILLDLMLPDRNGLLLCADLRDKVGVPIVICSGTRRKDDAALAFKLGAVDFIKKPFSVDELQVRVERAVQRAGSRDGVAGVIGMAVQQIGGLIIDRAQNCATLDGQALQLTPTEYRLLCAIATQPLRVLSREEVADSIWGFHDTATIRSLDVHMRRLRAKLAAAGPTPRVTTRRGFGYQLVSDASER